LNVPSNKTLEKNLFPCGNSALDFQNNSLFDLNLMSGVPLDLSGTFECPPKSPYPLGPDIPLPLFIELND
jgi:hypothetical protein